MAEMMSGDDYFMLLESAKSGVVRGESKDNVHTNEMQIRSFQFGVTNPIKSASAGEGDWKPEIHDVVVASNMSRASSFLLNASVSGTVFSKVTICMRKAGAKKGSGEANGDYAQFRFYNAIISSYSVNTAESAAPTESISFNFQQYEFMYIQQSQTGALDEKFHKGWHVGKNIEKTDLTLPYKGGAAKDK